MKHKLLAGLLILIFLISAFCSVSVSAQSNNAADKAQDFIGSIVACNQSDKNIQKWIDGCLSQNPANGSEWYILALCQYGDYDFSAYEDSLLSYLENNDVGSASSRLKFALVLIAMGSSDSYIGKVADEAIGKQGIMSYVFGLHLLNNIGNDNEKKEVINTILSLQKSDGGWAITGEYGDNDVTAMTIQALAPHCESNPEVKNAVDKALTLLSNRQKADGDYASYGIDNPESTAQVLVALSSLGIDCENDSRFIKNGKTLIDGIEKYRLSDGSFCHQIGKSSNTNATVQAFYAMVSYLRLTDGKTPLYILDNAKPVEIENESESTLESTQTENTEAPTESNISDNTESETAENTISDYDSDNSPKAQSYKLWSILIIVGLGGACCVILLIRKKKKYKNFVAILLIVALAVLVVCVTNFSTADDYYNGEDKHKDNVIGHVTLTIRCDTIVGKSESEYIPQDGVILDITEFEIEDGDSVYDILIEAARKYNIQMENNGSAEMVYISGINYLYEFDFGDLSGWVYHVNGAAPSVGCGEYKLADGDTIEWLYTCNLGNDVK